jgi:predicted NBD/HSP70 family sugar kinase
MKTADPELMRAINRFHVVDTIRRFGPIARVEICAQTELSPTTVSAITATLLDDGLIVPTAITGVRDEAARGRPRVRLALNPGAAHVVGVRLAPDQISVATTNFRADVLESLSLPIRVDRQPAAVIADLVEDGVRRAVADAGLTIGRIAGVCVGLPGVVARDTGLCRSSPLFTERDIPFAAALGARLGVPVSVDTDANLVALAEHWFGRGRDLDDFLVVSADHTLGLGIIHRGEVLRAPGGLAADLGAIICQTGAADGPGGVRLDDVASGAAVLAALPAGGEAAPPSRRLAAAAERAAAGDAAAIAAFGRAGRALGQAIGTLIALFAPPRIILVGALVDAGPSFLTPLRTAAAATAPEGLAGTSEIVHEHWSADNWARGAAAMTLRDLYGSPWNTTGPALGRRPRPTRDGGRD